MKKLIEQINTTFNQNHPNNCLETLKTDFGIIDASDPTASPSSIVQNKEEEHFFWVENPNQKAITFLAVDHCLIDTKDFKKCDCVIFDDNCFCFIEFKACRPKQRNEHKKKAIQQLANTIQLFLDRLSLDNYIKEAYVVVGYIRNRIPRKSASSFNKRIQFLEQYNVELLEGNSKTFP